MFTKKKKTFREDLYLPKRQLKKPKRSENLETKKKSFPWLMSFLWVLFLGTVGYMLFFSPVMKVTVLHVEGEKFVEKSRVEELFVAENESKLFTYIPRDNFFLFRTNRLADELRTEFPVIEEVRVTRSFPDKINVIIHERDLALLWCSRGPCYLINKNNVAISGEGVVEKRGELPLYTVVDTGGLPVEIGRTLFDYPFIEHLKENEERLRSELGIIIKPDMLSASRFSDELRMQTEAGWELLLNSRTEPEKNIKTLRLFFDQEIPFDRQGELRNVDLRTENRIYYSLKNQPTEEDKDASENQDGNKSTKEEAPKENKKKKD